MKLSNEEVESLVKTLRMSMKLFELGYEKHEWESRKTLNEYFDKLAAEIKLEIMNKIRGLGH